MGRGDAEDGQVPERVKPPDGGWGWVVLLGCFVITGFSYAFPKAVSIYFKELMHDFHVGYSDTAWISSIMLAMLYGTGPVSSIMVNQFGCRPVMLVGGLLASSGMILASFTTNIIELYLTAGVLTGLGMALNFQPSLIMLGSYFDKRRPLANGLAAAGSPVFLSALSPLGQVLLEKFGWRGGFLIMGGLLLNCCTCGAVMRPLEMSMKTTREKAQDKYEAKEMLPMGERADEAISTMDNTKKAKKAKKKKKPKKGKKLLDFSIFKNRGFVIYTIAMFIMVLGLFVPTILLVNYAKDTGVPDKEAAFLLSIIGFIDIFARPSCGVLAGLKWVRPHVIYLFSFAMLFNGLTDIISAKASTYTSLVLFCIFFGISYGMVGALQFEVLMAIIGSQKFSSAIGLVLLIEAIAVLIGPPSAGRLVDALKRYEVIFYLAGSEVVLSALFLAIASYCCLSRGEKKTSQPEENPSGGGGGSETEEAESDIQEGEDHPGDHGHLSHSINNAGGDVVNHIAENRHVDGAGQPDGEGEVLAPGGGNAAHTVERNSF
ncbi:monocarboxylate transporter 3 isoform X1 [Anolis carolinensis]|uniref:Solute carrier family 16 member 8 n=1 Tax=Anolis carolinensis TaxID=28377 RepID=H9GE12_ANOCA|nr:PREDICTED: monocarboxylate transporter 3 [Anolis carolinensis]|eukprot:XP_003227204.1 PREDICTED: monocarboxylate transporter 3 [Anolis carolinensis]